MYSQKYPVRKTIAGRCRGHTLDVSGEDATNVGLPEGKDASSEASEGESRFAHNSIIEAEE
jgi:hypothetical protein